ncbi:MAG: T9SS type A sorting domain-containing protein [Bacteroidetes bacterium]|nr:MAG: T9SS type A sorting domain-containing protein [Bacteroidota bacterium]
MRKILRCFTLTFAASLVITVFVQAQDRFAFAVTDINQNTGGWTVLRKLNLQTGIYSDALLNGVDGKATTYNITSKLQIDVNADARAVNNSSVPFNTGVAAIAYDKKNNRLYYTPMFIDQLRYIDLKTMKVYYVTDQSFTGIASAHNDEANVVTRMVIAPDGYGYAVTNDANTFIRFSTGRKLAIEQLGSLVDDPANTGISVHNRCSSWGGDLVADDAGNLYMFSARNMVFKISVETKVATWLGPIKGLPPDFTTNGVVVTDDQKLLAGSQVYSKSWFVIDPQSWTATEYKTPKGVYLTSDLANSNVLSTRKKSPTEIATIPQRDMALSNIIQLYPNPVNVSENQFKIQFNKLQAGDYTIELTDVTGKQVMLQKVSVAGEGQVQTINLKKNTAQGIYLVKVSDIYSKSVFTQKLVVQ